MRVRLGLTGILVTILAATAAPALAGPGARTAPSLGVTAPRYPGARLAVGPQHTCTALADGSVQCWGLNNRGQLGNNTSGGFSSVPVQVRFLDPTVPLNAVAVAVGGEEIEGHSCFLQATGRLFCWGANGTGQLGVGGVSGRSDVPLQVSTATGLTTAVAVTAGDLHTCALRADGRVFCWGSNDRGQLGNPDAGVENGVPVAVRTDTGLTDAVAVSAGNQHTCAVRADGHVFCWGDHTFGQLGIGDGPDRSDVPVEVIGGLGLVVAVAAGGNHTCVVFADIDGSVQCWGLNDRGQLGNNTSGGFSSVPEQVQFLDPTVSLNAVAVTAGFEQSCFLQATGRLFCWGDNTVGELGVGSVGGIFDVPGAVSTTTGLTNVVAVDSGNTHTCALRADGRVFCWGRNGEGQLGNPNAGTSSGVPVEVAGIAGAISATTVAAGAGHSCALRSDGTAACWGDNALGQVGNGTTDPQPSPVTVRFILNTRLPALRDIVTLAPGNNHTCALLANGEVFCWGLNTLGQLGIGTTGGSRSSAVPVLISPGERLDKIVALSAGGDHTCAVRVSRLVFCWGSNSNGQLGNDASGGSSGVPVPVQTGGGGLNAAVALAAGGRHTCVLNADGRVFCWGRNASGQLGNDASGGISDVPVQVAGGLDNAAAPAAGATHSCALLPNGTLRCWGDNTFGQLGNDASGGISDVPANVVGLADAVGVEAGGVFTCALRVTGRVSCWGDNTFGQLGIGSSGGLRDTPTAVRTTTGLTNAVAVGAGGAHACAARSDGAVFCWGANALGQIGTGGIGGNQVEPVEVPSFRVNIAPDVLLTAQSRIARVTALVNCPVGDSVQIRVRLDQDAVAGHGIVRDACTGRLSAYELGVAAQGPAPYQPGPATAEAEAVVRDGSQVVDTQEWTRTVEIQLGP